MKSVFGAIAFATLAFACASPPSTAIAQTAAPSISAENHGLKRRVAVGRFTNSTAYGRLLLSPGEADPIATQAGEMFVNALVSTNDFFVFERGDLSALDAERVISAADSERLGGVDSIVLGSITQIGRRNEGKQGFLNSQRRQAVSATVEIRLVDVRTGRVFFSTSGAGEATTETGEVAGFGTSAGHDATLNDRAIAAAIADTMTNVMGQLRQRAWFTDVLRVDGERVFISGGPSQGLGVGDRFSVETSGDVVVSAQSGLPITLPGSAVAQIEVLSFFGDNPDNEGAVGRITQGTIPANTTGLRVVEIKQ